MVGRTYQGKEKRNETRRREEKDGGKKEELRVNKTKGMREGRGEEDRMKKIKKKELG